MAKTRDDFRDKTVLITGAASGIGRLMALEVAARGGRLVLWDVDEPGLASVRAEVEARAKRIDHGKIERIDTYRVDVASAEAIAAAAERVLRECDPIDVVVNNAGIVSGRPLLEIADEAIERTFAVNVLALFRTTRAFLPSMIARGRGHVVTIASAGGLVGTAKLTDYCASKFAAVGFDESLRLELQRLHHPIDTTVVCPFYISTGMFAGVKTRFRWLMPILEPEYVARRIVNAIAKRRRRLVLPRFVLLVLPARIFPPRVFDAIMRFLGVNRTMDEFTGRAGRATEAAPARRGASGIGS